jgi:hypothetical protein
MDWERPVADKYGTIILSPLGNPNWFSTETRLRFDAVLKETLRRFAIDPDKIALIGRCATGDLALKYGGANLDVFSRIADISGGGWPDTSDVNPKHRTTEYIISGAVADEEHKWDFINEQILRRAGFRVKHVLNMRNHNHQAEDYDFVGRWFQESWAKPNLKDRSAPIVVADPLPVLTTDAIAKMTAFWTSFMNEPDSIHTTARRVHLREVSLPLGNERLSAPLVDIAALASIYPSVAADLMHAGLTAQQHDAYRVAIICAIATREIKSEQRNILGDVEATSVLGKNIAFMKEHPDEFEALKKTQIWHTP